MTDFYQRSDAEQATRLEELATNALDHWQLQGSSLSLIKYRENAVFAVEAPNGLRVALRIHRHGYHSDAELRSELEWMQALSAAGVPVPASITSASGKQFEVVSAPGVPEPRQVDVFAWLDGNALGSAEAGVSDTAAVRDNFFCLGTLAARVHNQATGWTPPAGFTRHAWDRDGLVGEQPFWGRFWELPALQGDALNVIQKARRAVADGLEAYAARPRHEQRYSMIHADLVGENVLVDADGVRLIDFDDAGFGWHLFELATALYFDRGESHYDEAAAALIAGYRTERELTDEELAWLPLFTAARSFTYLGWVYTRPETETAKQMTGALIELATDACEAFLTQPLPAR